jgi:hypothetical protein
MDHNPINPRGTVHLGRFHLAGPRVLYRPVLFPWVHKKWIISATIVCEREREREKRENEISIERESERTLNRIFIL